MADIHIRRQGHPGARNHPGKTTIAYEKRYYCWEYVGINKFAENEITIGFAIANGKNEML